MIMFLPLFFPIITSNDIKLAKNVRRRSHLHSQHKRKKRKSGLDITNNTREGAR
jgi:chorismate mutase